jgi:hypothetical protein
MAKVQIEFNTNEVETILCGLDQAFRRYEEVCHRVIDEYHRPEPLFIEQNIEAMKKFHDVAFKVGEVAKTNPYMNAKAVDSLVDMNGWEGRLQKIQKLLDLKINRYYKLF